MCSLKVDISELFSHLLFFPHTVYVLLQGELQWSPSHCGALTLNLFEFNVPGFFVCSLIPVCYHRIPVIGDPWKSSWHWNVHNCTVKGFIFISMPGAESLPSFPILFIRRLNFMPIISHRKWWRVWRISYCMYLCGRSWDLLSRAPYWLKKWASSITQLWPAFHLLDRK